MSPRTKPNLGIAMGVFVVYLAIVYAVWAINGLDYDAIAETTESIRNNYAISLLAGGAFLVIAISVMGWWRLTLFEHERAGSSWLWALVALLVVGTVISLAAINFSDVTAEAALWLVIGSVMVGFNEEITTRGLIIVGARGTVHREIVVVLISCVAFGALHLPNAFYGQGGPDTIKQFFFASFVGVIYYVLRRFTGTLIVPMVLHGAWDGALFAVKFSDAEAPGIPSLIYFVAIVMGIVGLVQIIRREPTVEPQLSA